MNTKAFYAVLAVVLIGLGAWAVFGMSAKDYSTITSYDECAAAGYPIIESFPEQCRTPDGRSFTRAIRTEVSDLIRVTAPAANATVSSPLTITGEARGTWYFEASFPARLLDANGVVLFEGPIQAQGDWMTEEFVPFSATINFKAPTAKTGTLVLMKDNPSGLPENDKELRIPVNFAVVAHRNAEFNSTISLAIGDSVNFSDSLVVSLKAIDDSRCKPGVQCIWAGELSPLLIVGKAKSEVRLGTETKKTVAFGNYTFTLKSATAEMATIMVARNAAAKSGVSGYVHVGPTCPVERMPPDPGCADKPYADAAVAIAKKNSTEPATLTKSDVSGKFSVNLAAGTYTVKVAPQSNGFLPRCEDEEVIVVAGVFTNIDISCDSGIR